VAIGGRVSGRNGKVLWRGGYFGFAGFAGSPDTGLAAGDSGYHGFGFAQHKVDAVAATGWLARADVLAAIAEATAAAGLELATPAEWAAALALSAAHQGRDILYTPFAHWRAAPRTPLPALPSAELLAALGTTLPEASRYYAARLSTEPGAEWRPKPTRLAD
jgi:hypothetical protein